jgi:hypothetical protein
MQAGWESGRFSETNTNLRKPETTSYARAITLKKPTVSTFSYNIWSHIVRRKRISIPSETL